MLGRIFAKVVGYLRLLPHLSSAEFASFFQSFRLASLSRMLLLALVGALSVSAVPLLSLGTPALLPPLPGSAVNVTLPQGKFTGKQSQGINSFLSLPFAQPPVGDLRLRRALPVQDSTKEFQATAFGPGCLQLLPIST